MARRITSEVDDEPLAALARCQGCGALVTTRFARVFGNNEDELYACHQCATLRELSRGEGGEAIAREEPAQADPH
jgi:protein-arginine kinase activator protein McsA